MEIGCRKERFSDVGDYKGVFIQQTIKVAKESIQGHGSIRRNCALCHGERCRLWAGRKRRELIGHQCLHEILKPDRIVAVVFDGYPIGCRVNRAAFRQQGESAQDLDIRIRSIRISRIGCIDELLDPSRAMDPIDVEWVVFTNNGFASRVEAMGTLSCSARRIDRLQAKSSDLGSRLRSQAG
jgi:hypothetical protein